MLAFRHAKKDGYICFFFYLSIDLVCVLLVDDLLNSGGDEDVALLVEHVLSLVCLGAGEADDGAVVDSVVLQGLEQSIFLMISGENIKLHSLN